jgi:hypothetical protein
MQSGQVWTSRQSEPDILTEEDFDEKVNRMEQECRVVEGLRTMANEVLWGRSFQEREGGYARCNLNVPSIRIHLEGACGLQGSSVVCPW